MVIKIFLLIKLKLRKSGDFLVAISASGNSENLINSIEYCNKNGNTFAITSFDGGI